MKARFTPVVLSLLAAVASGASAASGGSAAGTGIWVDPADPSAMYYRILGERMIDEVGSALMAEVRRVTATMPARDAVGALHLKNFHLPAPFPGQPEVTAIRRTGLRLRSAGNQPDEGDRAAIELIQKKLNDGDDLPSVLLQKIEVPGRPVEWRAYRPLGLTRQCVACHGKPDSLDPEVQAALRQLYPEDQALDFAPGDWRGIIRISMSPPSTVGQRSVRKP